MVVPNEQMSLLDAFMETHTEKKSAKHLKQLLEGAHQYQVIEKVIEVQHYSL